MMPPFYMPIGIIERDVVYSLKREPNHRGRLMDIISVPHTSGNTSKTAYLILREEVEVEIEMTEDEIENGDDIRYHFKELPKEEKVFDIVEPNDLVSTPLESRW